jgi:hypothetical protein
MALMIRKGNRNIAPINLNTSSMVKPTILNGSRISQISGKRNSIIKARGQHIANKIHHRIIARKVRISILFLSFVHKLPANFKNTSF